LAALMVCSWRQVGFWQDDRTMWEHAVACDSNNVMARCALGAVLENVDENAAAEQYRQALELRSLGRNVTEVAWARAHNGLGNIADRKRDYAAAITHFSQALELDSGYAQAEINLGRALLKNGELDEALVHFQRSAELLPNDATCLCCVAVVLAQQGKMDEAIAKFRQALECDPNFVIAHSNLALLLGARDDGVDEAIGPLQSVIKIDSAAVVAYQQLAQLLRKQGKTSEAGKCEERGRKAGRRNAEAQNLRGTELARQGRLDEAIARF
jgi:tetratricopeptide (TPR) repeat protein